MRTNQSLNKSRHPPRIFISYSHLDKKYTEELSDHFGILSRLKETAIWYDREIRPGAVIDDTILTYLSNSDIILLMVSPHFVKSDYCWEIEMRCALERHQSGNCIVVPIIVRPTPQWQKSSFGKLLAMPPNGKPITSFKSREDAYEQIVAGIIKILSGAIDSKPIQTEDLVKWELTVRRIKKDLRTKPIGSLLENELVPLCKDISIACVESFPQKGKYVFTSSLKSMKKVMGFQQKIPDFLSHISSVRLI